MKASIEKRLRLLRAVSQAEQQGHFPLMRELAQELGYRGESSIRRILDELVAEGYLSLQGGGRERQHRIHRLTPKGLQLMPEAPLRSGVPILGEIPAGPLAEAIQVCEEYIDPGDCLRVQPDDFFLRVKGKSMTGDGILHRDLVLLRPNIQANNGEIAAVQIRRTYQPDATLKHIHYQPGKRTVRLRASNPVYGEVIVPAEDVTVVAVYRGLLRRFQG
jgi:repressor LexA